MTSSIISIAFYIYTCNFIHRLVEAASVTPNYKSSCAFLDNRVYCYSGGYVSLGDVRAKRALDEHHYLDLTQNLVLGEISAKWTTVSTNPAEYEPEPVMAATITPISDTQYILDGGYSNAPEVRNKTRVFDIETNRWSTVESSNRELFNNSAIYMGTATKVPSQKRIYYWGGLTGQYPGRQVNTSTVLDYNKNFEWSINPSPLSFDISTRFGHTATLSHDGTKIFYIGGRIRTTNPDDASNKNITNSLSPAIRLIPYYKLVSMTEILIYDTVNGTWSLKQSPSPPESVSSRYMHTASLIPGTEKILIYGGAADEGNEKRPKAVPDYLYMLDTETLEYTRINENQPELGAGPRFGHSAVLCRNNTLIVLFGVDRMGLVTNDVNFLSLSASATWLQSFSLSPQPTPSLPPENEGQGMLSDKAVIGISIGSVLVIVLTLGGILFAIHRWRKKKRNSSLQQQQTSESNENIMRHQQSTSTMFEITNHDFLNDSRHHNLSTSHSNLPQLHKEYQRYSTSSFDNSLPPLPLTPTTPVAPMITTNISSTNNLLPLQYYYGGASGGALTSASSVIGTPATALPVVTSTAMVAEPSSDTAATATIHDRNTPPRGYVTNTSSTPIEQSNSALNSPTSPSYVGIQKPNQLEYFEDDAVVVEEDEHEEEYSQQPSDNQLQQQQQQRSYYQQQLQQRASTSSLTTSASAVVANRILYRQQSASAFRLSSTTNNNKN